MLVPHSPTQAGEAVVWVGAINEPRPLPALSLQSNAGQHPLGGWSQLDGDGFTLDYQRVSITNLTPAGRYEFLLNANGTTVANCRLRTLPDRLPSFGEGDFITLLASCFCARNDKTGSLGWTFHELPAPSVPTSKFSVAIRFILTIRQRIFSGTRTVKRNSCQSTSQTTCARGCRRALAAAFAVFFRTEQTTSAATIMSTGTTHQAGLR